MTVSFSNISFVLIVVLNVVQGTLTPNGSVSVGCGGTLLFTCAIPGEPIEWTTSGLSGISRGPFLARNEANRDVQDRFWSPDDGGDLQIGVSNITIHGFSGSDNGGTIQCINANNNSVQGMASISVDPLQPLQPPTNVTATVESCDVTLQWDQPDELADITTSVSCTPPSPGCAECTTSPCNITGLNPSTEYVFTVTLKSGQCRTNMSTTTASTMDLNAPTNPRAAVESCDTITLQWAQSDEPDDITTSVSCTPHSPGCAECTTSPCNITGLNPSTEYVFTVTLNSGGCTTSVNSTVVKTNGLDAPTNVVAEMVSCGTVVLVWTQPDEPDDINTSVSCTPHSPGCAVCATSPCNITGLNPSTEYIFTVTLNSSVCGTSMNKTEAFQINASSCVTPNSTSNVGGSPSSLAALVLLVLLVPLLYPLGVFIAQLLIFKDKTYCEVFWCCFCWRKDKSYECTSTELREHKEEAANQNVPKKEQVITNGDEIKELKRSKQEVVTYETIKKQEAKDGDAIADETVQQQGMPDGHHKQRRSSQRKEEVQYQNLGVAKKQEAVTNGDEMKKPKESKQEVINTGNVKQQQGNPDGIQYADLDFSEHQPGRNVMIPLVDPVTYADV